MKASWFTRTRGGRWGKAKARRTPVAINRTPVAIEGPLVPITPSGIVQQGVDIRKGAGANRPHVARRRERVGTVISPLPFSADDVREQSWNPKSNTWGRASSTEPGYTVSDTSA